MHAIEVFAPAKLNLGLKITGRYANGYHHLETLFVPVALYDRLTIRQAARDEVRYNWPRGLTADRKRQLALGALQKPLLWKSIAIAREYLEKSEIPLPPVAITVHKRIPSPAGLGGASSDAAVIVITLLRYAAVAAGKEQAAEIILTSPEFMRALEALGADVPYFARFGTQGQSARLSGIGHELSAVSVPRLHGWVCVPPFGFSTATMFAEVRRWSLPLLGKQSQHNEQSHPNLTLRLNEISHSDELAAGVGVVHNDFDRAAAAAFPEKYRILAEAKRRIALTAAERFAGACAVGMTGSGAALFAVTDAASTLRDLNAGAPVLQQRLGRGWQVLPFMTAPSYGIP